MFVLQDCSICFEEYDAQLVPHSISCGTYLLHPPASNLTVLLGHIFCRPCLDSLPISSPRCPHCRAHFVRTSIRKIICESRVRQTSSSNMPSEAEKIMWQTISHTMDSENDQERRRQIVQNNSRSATRELGFSGVRAGRTCRVLTLDVLL